MPRRISWLLGKGYSERYVVHRNFALLLRYWPRSVELVQHVRGSFPTWDSGLKALSSVERRMPAKPTLDGGGNNVLPPHADPGRWGEFAPLVCGYLTDPTWPDGTPRVPARVFITPGGGHWEFTLKEPSTGLLLVCTTALPDEGIPTLEQLLKGVNPPWRADPWARVAKGKKK
jgi:hypothetical protein